MRQKGWLVGCVFYTMLVGRRHCDQIALKCTLTGAVKGKQVGCICQYSMAA